jgi:hypothetical protein
MFSLATKIKLGECGWPPPPPPPPTNIYFVSSPPKLHLQLQVTCITIKIMKQCVCGGEFCRCVTTESCLWLNKIRLET